MGSVADLLVNIDASVEGLTRELQKGNRQLGRFGQYVNAELNKSNKAFEDFQKNATKELRAAQKEIERLQQDASRKMTDFNKSFLDANVGISALKRGLGALGVTLGAVEIGKAFIANAEQITNIENRLRSVTGSSEELKIAYDALFQSAQSNSVAFGDQVEVYTRLSRSLQGTGIQGERLVKITDTLAKSAILSGASSSEAAGALLQLSQAFSSGVLAGDEFRSVAEQMPILLEGLAAKMAEINNISYEEARANLKKFASEGQITRDVMVSAFEDMRGKVVSEHEQMGDTTGKATTRLKNSFLALVGAMDDVVGHQVVPRPR
jgi:tape measure domain-containing protein